MSHVAHLLATYIMSESQTRFLLEECIAHMTETGVIYLYPFTYVELQDCMYATDMFFA